MYHLYVYIYRYTHIYYPISSFLHNSLFFSNYSGHFFILLWFTWDISFSGNSLTPQDWLAHFSKCFLVSLNTLIIVLALITLYHNFFYIVISLHWTASFLRTVTHFLSLYSCILAYVKFNLKLLIIWIIEWMNENKAEYIIFLF